MTSKRNQFQYNKFKPASPFHYKPMEFKNFNQVKLQPHEFNVNPKPEDENSLDNTINIQSEKLDQTNQTNDILPSQPITANEDTVKD